MPFDKFRADELLCDGDHLNLAGLDVEVIHTPGHSEGSGCYKIEDSIFVGDTIFRLSYGRTDFYDGDDQKIRDSILKILSLDGDYTLYTGHDECTNLQFEKLYNPVFLEIEDDYV
jgi:glyoxylase-like metal-dependent hydrolase (beta-lactamase superfamily II)